MGDPGRWSGLLESAGALQSGHFFLSSGRHSAQYVQCARVLERPNVAAEVGMTLAARLPRDIDRVASPPLGAILIGYEVARYLDVPFLFAERAGDGLLNLRRGFAVKPGERIALVEDVITTGRTTGELLDLMERLGATVVGVAAIVDRSTDHEVRGHTIESLLQLSIPTYAPHECPLCEAGMPITKPGSRSASKEAA